MCVFCVPQSSARCSMGYWLQVFPMRITWESPNELSVSQKKCQIVLAHSDATCSSNSGAFTVRARAECCVLRIDAKQTNKQTKHERMKQMQKEMLQSQKLSRSKICQTNRTNVKQVDFATEVHQATVMSISCSYYTKSQKSTRLDA